MWEVGHYLLKEAPKIQATAGYPLLLKAFLKLILALYHMSEQEEMFL